MNCQSFVLLSFVYIASFEHVCVFYIFENSTKIKIKYAQHIYIQINCDKINHILSENIRKQIDIQEVVLIVPNRISCSFVWPSASNNCERAGGKLDSGLRKCFKSVQIRWQVTACLNLLPYPTTISRQIVDTSRFGVLPSLQCLNLYGLLSHKHFNCTSTTK